MGVSVTKLTVTTPSAHHRVRGGRDALRCPRHACGGQLFLDSEQGGHLFSAVCLLCNRSAGEVFAIDLARRHGIPWQTVEQAGWHAASFLWSRPDTKDPPNAA